jgi:hypothetical protein
MKKLRRVFLLLAMGIMVVVGGCSHMPAHFGQVENYPASNNYRLIDDPVPEEELCTLVIDGTLELRNMEGTGQRWNGSYWASSGWSMRIAAGERTLGFDYSSSSSTTNGSWITTTTSSAKGLGITYEFEPGHTYRVYPDINGKTVTVAINETSFPVQFGWRMGPYLGWQQGLDKNPFAGLFVLAQAGAMVPVGDIAMEFLAEANAGIGYSPFVESVEGEEPVPLGGNVQTGGTANFYFGKSGKKTGVGLGGGVIWGVGSDSQIGSDPFPYVRASFLPYSGDFWNHIRLFVDYSFTQEDIWKRLGLGMVFFF